MEIVCLRDNIEYFDDFISNLKTGFKLQRSFGYIRQFYRTRVADTYIAIHQRKFIGSYSLTRAGLGYMLGDLYVIPTYRGKNIGRRLVLDAMGRRFAFYWTLDTREDTVVFYKKLGFIEYGRGKMFRLNWSVLFYMFLHIFFLCLAILYIV